MNLLSSRYNSAASWRSPVEQRQHCPSTTCSTSIKASQRPLSKTEGSASTPSTSGRESEVQAALGGLKQAIKHGYAADPVYVNASAYLKTLGFSNAAEIARVLDVAMNPNSLFVSYNDVKRSKNANARPLDVEKDMRPVVDFLTEQRIPAGDVAKIISQHPPVLSYDVEQRLRPFWQYLESIGVPSVSATVIERPSLLGLEADTNLRKIVDYLQYIETPVELIVEYIRRSI